MLHKGAQVFGAPEHLVSPSASKPTRVLPLCTTITPEPTVGSANGAAGDVVAVHSGEQTTAAPEQPATPSASNAAIPVGIPGANTMPPATAAAGP